MFMPRKNSPSMYRRMNTAGAWIVLVAALSSLAICATVASASVPAAPAWSLDTLVSPTKLVKTNPSSCFGSTGIEGIEDECDSYQVLATDAGASPAEGSASAIVMHEEVPSGLVVVNAALGLLPDGIEAEVQEGVGLCEVSGQSVRCEYGGAVQPDEKLDLVVQVAVAEGTPAGPLPAGKASVAGGGAPIVTESIASEVEGAAGGGAPPFGASHFDFLASSLNGGEETQAGAHPYEVTTTIDLNNKIGGMAGYPERPSSVEDVKDIVVDLPVGFVGSTLAAPQCSFSQLNTSKLCPADTRVGFLYTFPDSFTAIHSYIYNMTPERGVPAEFAYVDLLHVIHVFYVHVVPTDKGYVLQTTANDIPQVDLTKIVATFWGDPALRDESGNTQVPFFTSSTDCNGEPPTAKLYMDSWQHPAQVTPDGEPVDVNEAGWVQSESKSPLVSGCNALAFAPELGAQPTTHESDKPSGLEFKLKVPQPEETGVLTAPTLKSVDVTLPEGFTVDPSSGDGLGACSESQIGWAGQTPAGPGELQNFNANPPECPEASKIGSLDLETPLIPRKLTGELFLATQNTNPFATTLAAYVVVHDPITGVVIKIAGEFLPNPVTGRLTALFPENPSLPFTNLELHFFGGPRAELATPESCGTFTTTSILEPWSTPDSGPAASPFDDFVIDEACPGGFSPSFNAGSTNLQAGAYTPFEVSFSRQDTDQELQGLTTTLPPGMLADVGSVPLCGEVQANAGTCPQSSQVGTVQTGVGPGPNPLFVNGKAYLTGPYNGGPFGLSVVVPAIAGPFNFGTVVVRQSIRIDPITAQVTDVSDPFPTIIDGIPLRLRRVDVILNRPGFTFNPTSCAKLAFTGSISGSPLGSPRALNGTVGYATQPGASAPVSDAFQVTNCASLKFQPKFTASTSGKTSRANGASLTLKVTRASGAESGQANFATAKIELPEQLPSRLTTLQKACSAAVFNTNPAACPAASLVGHVKVRTPILPVPLEGPAYFVSHGGEAFPSVIFVLQGDDVTLEVVSTTFISKTGITSATLKAVPDAPFTTFELTFPEGSYSALAANGNLCKAKLTMPTSFKAQNGLETHTKTPITVTGCTKHKAKKKAKKRRAKKKA